MEPTKEALLQVRWLWCWISLPFSAQKQAAKSGSSPQKRNLLPPQSADGLISLPPLFTQFFTGFKFAKTSISQ